MDPVLQDGIAVPTIVGLANRFKVYVPDHAKKWMPLLVIALGLGYAFMHRGGQSTLATITIGLTTGFAAAGVYDGARALARKKGEHGDTTIRTKPTKANGDDMVVPPIL